MIDGIVFICTCVAVIAADAIAGYIEERRSRRDA